MERSELLTVRFPVPEIERLNQVAAAKGYTRSELVRLMLRRALRYADDIAPKLADHEVRGARVAA